MSRSPRNNNNDKLGTKITLYVVGIALVAIAVLILLQQFGILSQIPGYVFVVIPLLIIGVGIIAGLNKSR